MRMLIINADDLGYDPAVTTGILIAMKQGIVSSATFMVNTPFSKSAADSARGLSLGLHFNLARFAPLWDGFPAEYLSAGELSESLAPQLPEEVVEAEALAQLAQHQTLVGRKATHVDVHKHLHRHPNVLAGLIAAAQKQQLPVRALDERMRSAVFRAGLKTTDHFVGDAGKEAFWTLQRLEEELTQLSHGATEFMCHPGHAPTALKSGYALQREVELDTFCDVRAKEMLARSGVRLGSFADLT